MGTAPSMCLCSLPGRYAAAHRQEAAALASVRSGVIRLPSALMQIPLGPSSMPYSQHGAAPEHVEIMHMRLVGAFPKATPELARHIRFNPLLVPEPLRGRRGHETWTIHGALHQIGGVFTAGPRQLDVAVVSVARPTADGTCRLQVPMLALWSRLARWRARSLRRSNRRSAADLWPGAFSAGQRACRRR